jgi:hypothetical protein
VQTIVDLREQDEADEDQTTGQLHMYKSCHAHAAHLESKDDEPNFVFTFSFPAPP